MDDIHLQRSEEEEVLFDEMNNESEFFRLVENTVIWTLEKVCHQNWLPLSVYRTPGDPIFSETIGAAVLQIATEVPSTGIGESFLANYYNSNKPRSIAVWDYIESTARSWFVQHGFSWISLLMYLGAICNLVMFLAAEREVLNIDDIVLSVTAFLEDSFAYDVQELGGWKAFEKACDIWMSKFKSSVFTERMRKRPKRKSIFYLPNLSSEEVSSQDQFPGERMTQILNDVAEQLNHIQI